MHALLHEILTYTHGPVNTRYTREMLVMSEYFVSHVHYMCGVATVDVDNELLIGFFLHYHLKFLMNRRVHTKYATIIDSIVVKSKNCLHANAKKVALIRSIYIQL